MERVEQKEKLRRALILLGALVIASGIMLLLSYSGNKTKGPLENFFTHTGQVVQSIDEHITLQQRNNRRSEKLQWFKSIRTETDSLKNPSVILLGASDNHTVESYEPIINLEDSLKTNFPLISIYSAWGSKPEEQFPKTQVNSILAIGSTPVITWEPWLSDFSGDKYKNLPPIESRDKECMREIAKGVYDDYIQQWAQDAKDAGMPIFVRLGHEMNDPYRYPWGVQNNTAAEYTAAWKHVHNIFVKIGATNVLWVWSPHISKGYFKEFYPGDNYVDYVGLDILNFGTVAAWSQWWSFTEIMGTHYKELSAFHKPMMICELGSLNVGGSRSKWFGDALDSLPEKYPLIKSIVFFHYSADKTVTEQTVDWYIKDDASTVKTIVRELATWKKRHQLN